MFFSLGHLHTNPGLIWNINHKIENVWENVWERMASLKVITAAFDQGQWIQEQGGLTGTRGMWHCGLVYGWVENQVWGGLIDGNNGISADIQVWARIWITILNSTYSIKEQ